MPKLYQFLFPSTPELKKKKADRVKVETETDKIRAETKNIETDVKIKQANALLDIIERSKKLGLKLQIDDDYLFINNEDILLIKEPENEKEDIQ